jgi:hypothetical protein
VTQILFEILAAIAGGIVILIAQWAYRKYQEKTGGYSGLWEHRIFDAAGQVVKRDRMVLKQRGDRVYGSIERTYPPTHVHRRWRMEGRLRGRDFFATFWSLDPTIPSYGCWYLHQANDESFSGYYLRLTEENHKDIAPIRLEIYRVRNANAPASVHTVAQTSSSSEPLSPANIPAEARIPANDPAVK